MTFPSITRASAGHPGTERPATPIVGNDATSPTSSGLSRLLDFDTVQRLVGVAKTAVHKDSFDKLLFEGILPDAQDELDEFASWILSLDEPKLSVGLLELARFSVKMDVPDVIKALRNAALLAPGRSYPNVTLRFELRGNVDVRLMLSQYVEMSSANVAFSNISIYWLGAADWSYSLGDFFNALGRIKDLKFVAVNGGSMGLTAVNELARLFLTNKSILDAELAVPDASDANDFQNPVIHAGYLRLCRELASQKELASFKLMYVTKKSQEIIGDFLGTSYSIRELFLSATEVEVTPRLIEGLKKNKSLQTLRLSFFRNNYSAPQVKGSMVPLMTLFEENGSCVTSLNLGLSGCTSGELFFVFAARHADRGNSTVFGRMIGSNSRLHSIALTLPSASYIDLLGIADGLEKNTALEERFIYFESFGLGPNSALPILGQKLWREVFNKIQKNWTLITLFFQNPVEMGLGQSHLDQLEQLLHRNRRFRSCGCSNAYIYGAAKAFMETLDYPSDPAIFIAEHLFQQWPKIAARSLAMINKDASKSAVDARRRDIAKNIINKTPGPDHLTMDGYLKDIAAGPFLATDLIYWMDADASTYDSIAQTFCAAVGERRMKATIIMNLFTTKSLTESRLRIFEKTFPPKQEIPPELRVKVLEAKSSLSVGLMLGLAYGEILATRITTALPEWCKTNGLIHLYEKYMDLIQQSAERNEKKV